MKEFQFRAIPEHQVLERERRIKSSNFSSQLNSYSNLQILQIYLFFSLKTLSLNIVKHNLNVCTRKGFRPNISFFLYVD